MKRFVVLPLLPCLTILLFAACKAEPAEDPPPTTRPGEPSLPPGFEPVPGSELERRIAGTCIPFDPWQDGSGRTVCVMTTPQDGTLGRLTTEGEGLDGGGVAGASEALLDNPPTNRPTAVDHRSEYLDGCLAVSHQQQCGWCTSHAATAALEALHCSKGCDAPELSEAHLRSNSRGGQDFGSCAGGWHMLKAMQGLVDVPIASAESWPYVANGRGLNEARPPAGDLATASVHQATAVDTVNVANLNEVKDMLASGREVVIGVPVYWANRVTDARTDWDADTGNIQLPPTANPCACGAACTEAMCLGGYHAIVLTGYDDAAGEFTFLNSWGKSWGDGGYGRMSYDYVAAHGEGGASLRDVRTDVPGATCTDEPALDAGADTGRDAGADAGRDAGADAGPDAGPPDGGMFPPPPLTPPDACWDAGDCASCTVLSGCGWCEGVGCRADSAASTCRDWHLATCPPSGDPCWTAGMDCSTCLAIDGCQWCGNGGSCYNPSLRTVDCNDPRNADDQCSDCAATDCGACAALDGCGWCPGAPTGVVAPGGATDFCVSGGETSSDHYACPLYRVDAARCTDDVCRGLSECDGCLDAPGCGWCDGVGVCMAGDINGPVTGETYGSSCGEDWDYYSLFCDNTEDSCASARLCDECLRNSSLGCAWDYRENRCFDLATSTGGLVIFDAEFCPAICNEEGERCGERCCDGLSCVVGSCFDCTGKLAVTESCDPTAPGTCCGWLTCSPATGGGHTCCIAQFEPCAGDAECCGDMTCTGGNCACRSTGESCQSSRECCGDALCSSGVCT